MLGSDCITLIIDKYNTLPDIQIQRMWQKLPSASKTIRKSNLIITGCADVQTGNPAYNLKLSQRRAEAVCNMMVKEFGEIQAASGWITKVIACNHTKLKNEWNRVVVFITEARNKWILIHNWKWVRLVVIGTHGGSGTRVPSVRLLETNWVVPLGPNDGIAHDLTQWLQRIATERYTPWHYHQVRQPSTWHWSCWA